MTDIDAIRTRRSESDDDACDCGWHSDLLAAIDALLAEVKRQDAIQHRTRCCAARDGVHQAGCYAVTEMEYVRCANCDVPVWMADMAYGQCRSCRGEAQIG